MENFQIFEKHKIKNSVSNLINYDQSISYDMILVIFAALWLSGQLLNVSLVF